MTGWQIVLLCIGCVAALIATLLLMPVGACVDASGSELSLRLKIGPLRIPLSSLLKKTDSEKKPEKKKTERKEEKPSSPESASRSTLQTVMPLIRFFVPRIRINSLLVTVKLGGQEDPFGASLRFGEIQAAYGMITSALENLCIVKKRELKSGVDYFTDRSSVSLSLVITIRVWDGVLFLFHSVPEVRSGNRKA